ncbi:zinc finger protein 830 [Neltuma alba]|uniref:zinc finger protein 830 n=1 Tax=Neltuma alba TaxID=207710 RepID=UPI0010A2FEEB|nr:zinc finger protein 830 [Prosopis alba]
MNNPIRSFVLQFSWLKKMDAQAQKKALFRAKLNAQKKEKRIESPLVRYNEFDQPVCRVCDVVLKHESNWDAHQISRKHREAISNLKANAAGLAQQGHAKPVADAKLPKPKPEHASESQSKMPNHSQESLKPQPSSVLPPDFFDNNDARKPRSEKDSVQLVDPDSNKRTGISIQSQALNSEKVKGGLHINNAAQPKGSQEAIETRQTSSTPGDTEAKQIKGILPEGFFDNKEADLRARGIKPVKPDVKDEYKEFEKLIQDDLLEVDNRFEEEEIDAAEMIEEAESVEQRNNRERVEKLRKRRLELKAAKDAKHSKTSEVVMDSKHDEPSSDEDSDDNFAVDWRAQHL